MAFRARKVLGTSVFCFRPVDIYIKIHHPWAYHRLTYKRPAPVDLMAHLVEHCGIGIAEFEVRIPVQGPVSQKA